MSKIYQNNKGQLILAIPCALARELGIEAGDEVDVRKRRHRTGFAAVLRGR